MSESGQQREPDRNVDSGNPDVLLDIPKVSVDSIRLAVDGLEADLSLRARVANLLQVDAGVRVHLSSGELNIDGVNAEAQLRVRLEQLTRILGRALDTLDNNPHIIEALARTAGTAVDDVNRSAQQLAAGAAEVKASSRHSDGVRDEPGRQVGAASPVADRDRLGFDGPGSGRPSSGRPGSDRAGPHRPGSDRADAGRSGAGPVGSAPDAGGPGPRAGGPGSADQSHPQGPDPHGPQPEGRRPEGRQPQGQQPEAGAPGGHRPEGQRHEGLRHAEEVRHEGSGGGERPAGAGRDQRRPEGSAGSAAWQTRNQPGRSTASGPSPSGDGDGGLPGAAQAAAQSAAQLAEQAGETLRQAGRSVWEAIQGSVTQHRPQGRRDH
ncbi:hypothetical protein OG400_07600 [Micromonospora ureilytica]|uniref:hypothetical protein n=1 Tax=Micromonospora ureilytica TaxID=709868 RepID=UPI002E0DC208|nr:hypothetical protein OG400_07600 [Micromonospora ureilytica]